MEQRGNAKASPLWDEGLLFGDTHPQPTSAMVTFLAPSAETRKRKNDNSNMSKVVKAI